MNTCDRCSQIGAYLFPLNPTGACSVDLLVDWPPIRTLCAPPPSFLNSMRPPAAVYTVCSQPVRCCVMTCVHLVLHSFIRAMHGLVQSVVGLLTRPGCQAGSCAGVVWLTEAPWSCVVMAMV